MERTLNPIGQQPSHTSQQNQVFKIGYILIGVVVIAAALVGAYIWFSGGNGQASAPITAPVLVLEPNDTRSLLHITADESQVRFIIDETLLGNPKTVIGVTDQVAGDMLVDFANPEHSQLGAIRINARTLETDNEIRNRALRGQILQSERDEFEFIEFIPTELIGMPETVTFGEQFSFEIEGYLTIHGVTRVVTFEATLLPESETRLHGTAVTTVRHQDFDIIIPSAPGVAGVSDEVRLQIDFVATVSNDIQ
jgi:polyisoprenoid-binding protein YceI